MTEAFDLMSNSIFDNIIITEEDRDMNLNDIWKNDLTSIDINSFPLIPTYSDVAQEKVPEPKSFSSNNEDHIPPNELVRHDCMWSGTCLDESHPKKKRNYNFCSSEGEVLENYRFDLETELTLENNLPSIFQSLGRNMQNYPAAGIFQEIFQNATISCRPSTTFEPIEPRRETPQQMTQFQQTYQSIPIIFKNNRMSSSFDAKIDPSENKMLNIEEPVKFQPITFEPSKLIKIENVKFEPITVEHVPLIPENSSIQQVFFCSDQQMPVPYYPQFKYEQIPAPPPQVYIQCPNDFDNGSIINNQIDQAINNALINPELFIDCGESFGKKKNFKLASGTERKKSRTTKKKTYDKRKISKKTKIKEKKLRETRLENAAKRRALSVDSDENPIEKRNIHNSMERQRRIGLKNLFIELKHSIPTLDERERVPKVSILREAIDYCSELRFQDALYEELKKKNNKLKAQYLKLYKAIMMDD